MTQHLSPEDTAADRLAMRHLAIVVGSLLIAATVLAVCVGVIVG